MKLKFKNQEFQTDAASSIVDLFKGQEKLQSTFEITNIESVNLVNQNEFGVGNVVRISKEELLNNMHEIQRKNNLPLTDDVVDENGALHLSFSEEMETGTGKTYVYTKTIFELNKRYGFTKFIIVVPSVAIREGVYKSLEVTREHFENQYDNVPCRYFIYNSSKLSDVRQFATSSMCVLACDNDIRCAMMAYIQLSYLGIPAVVVHGDSLCMKEYERFYTPVYVMEGWIWREPMGLADEIRLDDEKMKCMMKPMYEFVKNCINGNKEIENESI